MQTFAVLGDPIAQSWSPNIHRHFAEQTGIALSYAAERVPAGKLREYLESAPDALRGCNVTSPLKAEAAGFANSLSEAAQRCGSVNTLMRTSAGWHGHSTDGLGLLRDLNRLGFDLDDAEVLILGAGGAVAASLPSLLLADPARITIANRTLSRAQTLCEHAPQRMRALAPEALEGRFDLVINARSNTLHGEAVSLPAIDWAEVDLAYDLSYGPAARPLLDAAKTAGARQIIDGRGMLIEQAAASFELWHGVLPETAALHEDLAKRL